MKRKITLISLVLVLVMIVTCTLFACNYNEDTTYKKNHAKKLSDDSSLIGIFEGSEEIKNNLASSQYVLNENGGSEQEVYERENDYIYFGSYPQSLVTDSVQIDLLNTFATELNCTWYSYDYYIANTPGDYMWYTDLELNEIKYRGVYFTSYRPYYTSFATGTENSSQDNNGYTLGTVYWFRYEPIKWRILSEENGYALLLADLILDSQQFNSSADSLVFNNEGPVFVPTIHANNWEYSTIRSWLNNDFYNTAFNDSQSQNIVEQSLNNTETAYNGVNNNYAISQRETSDKVFLLSYEDMVNEEYGFNKEGDAYDTARRKQTSDYAKIQGACPSTNPNYSGKGWWWLRSPDSFCGCDASGVRNDGRLDGGYYVLSTSSGVVPALMIKL